MNVLQRIIGVALVLVLTKLTPVYGEQAKKNDPIPTHADAALILAKYTGLFDRYVSKEATLNECVTFLNETGIYFGLLEVINGTEFTLIDCARVMGQIELVFSGEAKYLAGSIKLPKNIDSWEGFCIMNDVNYTEGYRAIVQALIFTRELGR